MAMNETRDVAVDTHLSSNKPVVPARACPTNKRTKNDVGGRVGQLSHPPSIKVSIRCHLVCRSRSDVRHILG
ncbi:hypothetical protein OBBRIDRAFT_309499 [Obba rivulosa]|uniref:Uncharacterized protein n=1 Tax=Obba rivulosa TaxID=1052685 RepID=A0A8E2DF25_9APHY|nr:hypothetical protein OBBRIDRAFT_309499 [Obba rivulosa]